MSEHKKESSQPASKNNKEHQNINLDGESSQPQPTDPVDGGDTMENGTNEEKALEEPKLSAQEFEELQQELEKVRSQSADNFDGWQRERADFLNYKKRIERDQSQLQQNIKGGIIKKFLPVVDDLERALKNRPTQDEAAAWAEGIELIYRKLQNILESEGLEPILAEGEMFDPNLHEAVTHEESPDHESGQVIGVLQQGYTLGDRVLRPALVRVAR
jgi:molecular chaperone GrpE